MKRYWISWIQKTHDFRPLTDPPTTPVLGWWCSGYVDCDGMEGIHLGNAVLCAAVTAKNKKAAMKIVHENWAEEESDIGEIRFCSEQSNNWTPGNRFPITDDWSKQRFGDVI